MAKVVANLTYEEAVETARLLKALADDLTSIAVDPDYPWSLHPEVKLSRWKIITREAVCLTGMAEGHPGISDGPIRTSELFYIDEQAGLARTLSRWYRLADRDHFPHGPLN